MLYTNYSLNLMLHNILVCLRRRYRSSLVVQLFREAVCVVVCCYCCVLFSSFCTFVDSKIVKIKEPLLGIELSLYSKQQ